MSLIPDLKHSDIPSEITQAKASHPQNDHCFECGALHPTWASVTLSVYLCMVCAGKHRGLGTHLSAVRSLTLDNWPPKQVCFMVKGGNARASAALVDVMGETSLKDRYESVAAQTHRKQLKTEVHTELGLPLEEKPIITRSNQNPNYSRFAGANSISSDQFTPHRNKSNSMCPCCNIL